MSNPEITRQNVQESLDRRSEAKRQKEADLEDQARKLRAIISSNHTTKTAPKRPERPQDPPKAPKADCSKEEAIRGDRRAQRAMETASCLNWYRFLIRVFGPMLIAAMAVSSSTFGVFPIWLTIPVALTGCALSIATCTAWTIYHWKEYVGYGACLFGGFNKK
ncbi:MAG: hypothetical protein ACI4PO_09315 [Faecousia sp.]